MSKFYYVYMLTDVATGTHFYTGVTEDLHARLDKHNSGEVPHTSKFKPWRIETAVAFDSQEKAAAFEKIPKIRFGKRIRQTPLLIFLRLGKPSAIGGRI